MDNINPLPRRTFLIKVAKVSALAAGATAGGIWLAGGDPGKYPPLGKKLDPLKYLLGIDQTGPVLAIATGIVDGAELTRKAIAGLGGIKRFVKPGERVLIKPNVAFDRAPMLGATTAPAVVAAVVRLCLQAGARQVMVTDNPIHKPMGAFQKSGIGPAVKAAGGEIFIPTQENIDFERIPIPGSRVLRFWDVLTSPLRQADRIIGIAPVKDHNLCGASMGLKNWYGLLGGRRQQFHQQIHEVIADFPALLRPTLTIVDATRVLMHHGPTGGSLADVRRADTVAATTDQVAADAFGWTLLLRDDPLPLYIRLAESRGYGTAAWEKLQPIRVKLENG